jgi:hypothetical protein
VARALTLGFDGTDSFLASVIPRVLLVNLWEILWGIFLFLILQIRPFQISVTMKSSHPALGTWLSHDNERSLFVSTSAGHRLILETDIAMRSSQTIIPEA